MAVYTLNSRGGGSNQGTLTQMLRQSASAQTLSRVINARSPGGNGQIVAPAPFPVQWDVGWKSANITLSNNNLTVAGTASFRSMVRANYSAPSGYWELTLGTMADSLVVGFASANRSTFDSDLVREELFGGSGVYYAIGLDQGQYPEGPGGSGTWGGITTLSSAGYASGDIVGCWLVGDGTARIYVNGQLRYTFTQLPAGGLFPALSTGNNSGLVANFGASAFSLYQPTGSASWDGTQATKSTVNWGAHNSDMLIGGTGNLTASINPAGANADGRPIYATLDLTPTNAQPRYFEVTINATNTSGWSVGVGISNQSSELTYYPGRGGPGGTGGEIRAAGDVYGPEGDSTYGYIDGSYPGFAATAVIGVLVLGDAVRYYKNGVFYFEHKTQPGSQFPAVSLVNPANPDSVTANFGATAFSFMPAGSTSWDGTRVSTANAGYLYGISGSFSITGNAAGMNAPKSLAAGSGSFSIINDTPATVLSSTYKGSGITLSGGNLTATSTNGSITGTVLGTKPARPGAYFEITINSLDTTNGQEICVGLAAIGTTLTGSKIGLDAYSLAWSATGQMLSGGGGYGVDNASFTVGDVLGVQYVSDTQVKFYKNGVLQTNDLSGGIPAKGLLFPAVTCIWLNDAVTANFGATAFSYLPSGATGWDGTGTSTNVRMPAASGTFNITGRAASMAVGLPASSGTFAITGNAATLGAKLPALSASFAITGYSAGMAIGVPAGSGSFAYTGYAAGLKVNLPASSGTFTYTGNAATLIRIAKLPAGSGAFAITGNPAAMGVGLPAGSGAFNYTGYAASDAVGEPAGSGAFAITGRAASMAVGLAAGSGTFLFTGYSASYAVQMPAGSGAFSITGRPAANDVQMPLGSGSFAITGYDASLVRTIAGHDLAAGSGSFVITGNPASLAAALSVGSGSFAIVGADASFGVAVTVGSGVFTITGYDAALLRMGAHRFLAAGSGSFLIAGGDTIWRRFRPKYATWVQPITPPPVQVPYESLIRRTDPAFRKDGQRLPEYEFTTHTFEADPTQRGAYEAP